MASVDPPEAVLRPARLAAARRRGVPQRRSAAAVEGAQRTALQARPPGRADRPVAEYRAAAQPELRRPRGRAARLREALAAQQVAAITAVHGIGGVGKSALASEYAHVFGDEYPGGRFWLPAENHDDLRDLFRTLEAPLNLTFTDDERKDRDAGYRRVRAELERRPGTLLVLDNVNRPALLAPAHLGAYRPDADRVHVLVTMREEPPADPAGMVRPLALDQLSPDDGRKLLQRYRDFGADEAEWQAARRIVSALEGHALSLEVVGVFVWQRNRTEPKLGYIGYFEWMKKRGMLAALEGAARGGKVALSLNVEATVSRLLEPTLAGLSEPERRPGIRLAAAGGMGGAAVAERVGWSRVPRRPDAAELWDADPWLEIVTRLRGLRLFGVTKRPEIVRVHRVVQAVVGGRMGQTAGDLRERLVAYAVKRGELLIEGWVDRTARWEIDPLHKLATQLLEFEVLGGGRLANRVFRPLQLLGELPEAQRLLRKAVAVGEKHLAPEYGDLAISYSNLALVEQDLGDPTEARNPAAQGRRHRQEEPPSRTSPPGDPVLESRHSRARTRRSIAARWLLRRSVAIGEKHLVPNTLRWQRPTPTWHWWRRTWATWPKHAGCCCGPSPSRRSTSVPKIPSGVDRPLKPRADRAEAG